MKVTVLRIWVMLLLDKKEHSWYWSKRFENYIEKPTFDDVFVLECVKKQLKLDVSQMIDTVDNFGNPEYDWEGYEEFIERKYSLKLLPEKMNQTDINNVLMTMYGVKTKALNPKKVTWDLFQISKLPQNSIDPIKFNLPQEMIDYLSVESNLFKQIIGEIEGPTIFELRSVSNLQLIDVIFSPTDEHAITASFLENDPNKDNEDVQYHFQAVDLIRENDLYQNEGLLIWIPALKKFGTYDPEHENLIVFPDTIVKDVIKNFGKYIVAQWNYGPDYLVKCGNIYDFYEPWKYFELKNF